MSCGTSHNKNVEGASDVTNGPATTGAISDKPRCPICGEFIGKAGCKNLACGQGERIPLDDYVARKRADARQPSTEILERWTNRVLKYKWQLLGEQGAELYLERFGNGIKLPKVLDLAEMAEQKGCPEIARGFWKKAYRLEIGLNPNDGAAGPAAAASAPGRASTPTVTGLPEHLQPGRVETMQPIDAPKDREAYISDPHYWGQPKRDGQRQVITASPDQRFYQARSTNLHGTPSLEIEQALGEATQQFGAFVLDGEVYYPDANGGEHRTAGQAAKVNARLGKDDVEPKAKFAIFTALHANGTDLTEQTERDRIEAGATIGEWLAQRAPESFEVVPTARTTAEKAALAAKQKAEGREGEVWVRKDCRYIGGETRTKAPPIVRTKYIQERDVVIMGLSTTPVEGRPFGSIEVGQYRDGELVSLGFVGTGFDAEEMADLVRRNEATPGEVVITIASQGLTEDDQLWQGRYRSPRDDKKAKACVI